MSYLSAFGFTFSDRIPFTAQFPLLLSPGLWLDVRYGEEHVFLKYQN